MCLFVITLQNFTTENLFHKIVYILQAVSQLGRIAGPVGTFKMCHFVDLCAICAWPTALLIPAGICRFSLTTTITRSNQRLRGAFDMLVFALNNGTCLCICDFLFWFLFFAWGGLHVWCLLLVSNLNWPCVRDWILYPISD